MTLVFCDLVELTSDVTGVLDLDLNLLSSNGIGKARPE